MVSSNQRITRYYLDKLGLDADFTDVDTFQKLGVFEKFIEDKSKA